MKHMALPFLWTAILLLCIALNPDFFGQAWFPFLAMCECIIIAAACWSWSAASVPVITIGVILTFLHSVGWYEYTHDTDVGYSVAVPLFELLQGSMLVLLGHKKDKKYGPGLAD